MRLRKWISGVAIILFLLGVFIVRHEMCTCPSHWAFLSVFGVVALACGPRVYRLVGIAAIAAAFIFTYQARQTQKEIWERWGPFLKAKQHP
jgi:hypothetical protein